MRTSCSLTWLSSPCPGRRAGGRGARRPRAAARRSPAWIAIGAFLVWVVRRDRLPAARLRPYPWHEHLVTTGKYVEYALLAPAAVLLVRRVDDSRCSSSAHRWSRRASSRRRSASSSSSAGESRSGWPAGYRQPSFLGHHDFASLSGLALAIALAAIALPPGASTGGSPFWPASAGSSACSSPARSRGARAGRRGRRRRLRRPGSARRAARDPRDLGRRARWRRPLPRRRREVVPPLRRDRQEAGADSASRPTSSGRCSSTTAGGSSSTTRSPGAGWQASNDEYVYGPLLPSCTEVPGHAAASAFPSPEHPYGDPERLRPGARRPRRGRPPALPRRAADAALASAGRRSLRGPPDAPALVPACGCSSRWAC